MGVILNNYITVGQKYQWTYKIIWDSVIDKHEFSKIMLENVVD
jgi:hypothetical protein